MVADSQKPPLHVPSQLCAIIQIIPKLSGTHFRLIWGYNRSVLQTSWEILDLGLKSSPKFVLRSHIRFHVSNRIVTRLVRRWRRYALAIEDQYTDYFIDYFAWLRGRDRESEGCKVNIHDSAVPLVNKQRQLFSKSFRLSSSLCWSKSRACIMSRLYSSFETDQQRC